MKKKLPFIGLALVLSLFLINKFGCNKSPTIQVQKITKETIVKEGEWEAVDFEETEAVDSSDEVRLADIIGERDLYFSRYSHYKKESFLADNRIRELEESLISSNSESETVEILLAQIDKLKSKSKRDSTLIQSLFANLDKPVPLKKFKGKKITEFYETFVEVSAFGKVPEDGIKIKTNVLNTTTTIEDPFEVWKKNSVELYVGGNLDLTYLFGAGYERRGKVLGIFIQGDYLPKSKEIQGRAGGRVHF